MNPNEQLDPYGRSQPPQSTPPHPGQPSEVPVPGGAPSSVQPVAYDQQGRPLYAHPPGQPQMVYLARPVEAQEQVVTEATKARHDQSAKMYPNLNLSDNEYIISAVRRHPIGLLRIWGIALAIIVAFMGLFTVLFAQGAGGGETGLGIGIGIGEFAAGGIGLIIIVIILTLLGALVATYVYNNNRFYLTNESVVQEIQTGPLSKHEQTVSLANIEDASFEQHGILPTLLNYGRIRLSTEGDETTYRFSYVANPKQHVATLNNAVEAFKNGRPIEAYED